MACYFGVRLSHFELGREWVWHGMDGMGMDHYLIFMGRVCEDCTSLVLLVVIIMSVCLFVFAFSFFPSFSLSLESALSTLLGFALLLGALSKFWVGW